MLDQASQHIDDQTTTELQARHERLEKDQRTVHELNDIFEERWMISRSDTRLDNTRAKKRYPTLFHQYGLDVGREAAEQSVQKIRLSLIVDALSSGMAEWFFVDPQYPGLLDVVDLLDPEPDRTKLRIAIAKGDDARISDISKTIDGSRLAPAYAIGLSTHPACEDGLRILTAAWTTHPDSFPLALAISRRSCGSDDKSKIEAVGWGRTAVAIRPNNPLSHYYLALALGEYGQGDKAHAVEELRRAIQLAPRFAKAYGQLAMHLRNDKKTEAFAAARKAIELDNKSLYGHVVILGQLMAKEEYIEAGKVYQRMVGLRPVMLQLGPLPEDDFEEASFVACIDTIDNILEVMIRTSRSFDAFVYSSGCAAALAGTGQGLDAPPPAERPAIRKHALKWLTTSFDGWKKHATVLPVLAASSAGLIGSPLGHGPLLAVSALSPENPNVAAAPFTSHEAVHQRMSEWLSDPDLAGVRDDQWLAKLPAEEREQWRRLWNEVRSLRDMTSSPKASP